MTGATSELGKTLNGLLSALRSKAVQQQSDASETTLLHVLQIAYSRHVDDGLALDWLMPVVKNLSSRSSQSSFAPEVNLQMTCSVLAGLVEYNPSGEKVAKALAEVSDRASEFDESMKSIRRGLEEHIGERISGLERIVAEDAKVASASAEAAKVAARTAGATVHSARFEDAVRRHSDSAAAWLWATLVMAAVWLLGAIVTTANLPEKVVWQQLALATLILSATLGFVGFCAKMYATNRHNVVINEHRATAIQTMEAFIAATSDEAVRDAVILQVTASTFAPLSTGYDGRGSTGMPPTHVVELLKATRGDSKG